MENLKNIELVGEISLQPYDSVSPEVHNPAHARCVVLLGPTGAGKSSLVEALAGPSQKLSLSSDQLAGYTQHISAFRVVNASVEGGPLYLVDTPGFSDSKFSEKEILDMVNAWLHQNGLSMVRVLYLVPISGTRLPGMKQKTLEMLLTFLKSSDQDGVRCLTFVTTMWDALYDERALSRGRSNFEQLRDKQLKPFINDSAKIRKFTNTQLSAMQILDAAVAVPGGGTMFIHLQFRTPQLYRDLCEWVKNALQEKRNIENDLTHPEAQTNLNLRNTLEKNFRENDKILTKFIEQFTDYGDAPEGFEDAAQRLRREIEIATNCPRTIRSTLPKDSTEPDVNTLVKSPSMCIGDQILQTLPSVDDIDPLVVKLEPGQPEWTSIPIITPERHASFRDMHRRTLEVAKRPWKKLFGPKH